MKKLLSTVLALSMILALSIPSLAAPKVPAVDPQPGAREAVILNAGFHCNAEGGNGRVWVAAYDLKYEADKALKKAGVGGVLENLIYLDDNCWLLENDTDYVCPKCGSTVWVSYSNKSGVPDGKNIQLTHGILNNYAEIEKVWADENPNGLEAIFDIYALAGFEEDGVTPVRGDVVLEYLIPGVRYSIRPGTYVVAEREKTGYVVQPDQVITVSYNQGATVSFTNEPTLGVLGAVSLTKYLKQGQETKPWNNEHEFWGDNAYIWFDLYNSNEAGEKLGDPVTSAQIEDDLFDEIGARVVFGDLTVGEWYVVAERIDIEAAEVDGYADIARLNSYAQPLPEVHFQAKEDMTETDLNFNPIEHDLETGYVTQSAVIISNAADTSLTAYELRNSYSYYFDTVMKTSTPIVNWGNSVLYWAGTDYAGYMRDEMMKEAEGAGVFFGTVDNIEFEGQNGEIYYPQFVWNTDNFGDGSITGPEANSDLWDLKVKGNTVIFEKSFDLLENIVTDENGKVPFYIAGDDAFLIYVNGKLAGFSKHLEHQNLTLGSDLTEENLTGIIGDRGDAYVQTESGAEWTWKFVYEVDVLDYLIADGNNTISIVAINRADIQSSASWNNPAAFIFASVIDSYSERYVFINELPEEEIELLGAITVTADVEMYNEVENWVPVYANTGNDTLVSYRNHDDNSGENGNATGLYSFKLEENSGNGIPIAISNIKNGQNSTPIYEGATYSYEIIDDEIIFTLDDENIFSANVGLLLGNNAKFENGHPNDNILGTNTGKFSITLPYNGEAYLYLHIQGGITYFTGEWEYCCDGDNVPCDTCQPPVLTASIYDAEGQLVAEADLESALVGPSAAFADLTPGSYTVKLYNGENYLAEVEVEVTDATVEVEFDTQYFRCGCDPVIIKDVNHSH